MDDIPLFPDDKVTEPRRVGGGFSFADVIEEPPLENRHANIDGDMVIYACCYSKAAQNGFSAVCRAWDSKVNGIMTHSHSSSKTVYLTNGPCNFRYLIYPEYKATRVKPKPTYYDRLREWVIRERGATMVYNAEADDALNYNSYGFDGNPDTTLNHTIICTDDKDLDMVPGWHYRLRTQECYYVEGDFGHFDVKQTNKGKKIKAYGPISFQYQLLLGDSTDNIPGLGEPADATRAAYGLRKAKGCGPVCAYTILSNSEDYLDASFRVSVAYNQKLGEGWYKHYLMNARLLWMQSYVGEMWVPPEDMIAYWKRRASELGV